MKIATWNVNSLKVRLPQVLDWLTENAPDVLALQETKLVDDKFPAEEIAAAGYHSAYSGQRTYNGVALLSRAPAAEVLRDLPGLEDPDRRIIAATFGDTRILNLYVVNGQSVGSPKYAYKLEWLDKVRAFIAEQLRTYPWFAVMGDFNIAPTDRDVHDPNAWREKILCSTPERDALAGLTALGLVDVFRSFEQEEKSFSWWDYRAGAFRRNLGLRIDLILASPALRARCTACVIDKGPRAAARPSDHTPVIAEFRSA